uniref:Chaperone protein dnaJ 15 n=1 Tax=Caligus clemensi TaxID=344056 RepID=C1BZX6_CALCM|nr:Chaperone protein dnaJ 15 [Caligus clemensi]
MSSSSPDDHDWYAILGVSPHATAVEIKAAYKALAKENHPDKNIGQEEEASQRFALISTAHSILCDPRKRHNYDNRGTVGELNNEMVVKVEELGPVSKFTLSLFNRMGIHIPTDLSVRFLEEARKAIKRLDGLSTLKPKEIQTVSLSSQKAKFFMIDISEEGLSQGVIINCVSLSGDKFKALFFDSLGEVSMMEESQPIDKGTETNFFFLPHPTYHHEKFNPMLDRSKEPPLFNLLNNYHKNTYSIFTGRHLFAIYQNNLA